MRAKIHPAILTTEEIKQTYKYHPKKPRNRYAIPVAKPLELLEVSLPVPPYVLGAWLGDGNSYSAQITTHKDDLEIADYIRKCGIHVVARQIQKNRPNIFNLYLDPVERNLKRCWRGHDLDALGRTKRGRCSECARQHSKAFQYGFVMDPVVNMPDTLSRRLRALEVLRGPKKTDRNNVKHIPDIYLRSSINQRFSLLQGLMDTDGHITKKGRCEFTTTAQRLADGFGELLATLGIKFTRKVRYPTTVYKGKRVNGAKAWRFSFMVYDDKPVFRLQRKLDRQVSRQGRRTTETERRRIVSVESVPSVPVRCIQVDSPSHLYLAGSAMVPTHNTEIINNTVGYHIDQDPAPIMVVLPTERDAESWSKDRFAPMVRDTERLKGKLSDPKSRDGSNKILHKKFTGGQLTLVGSNAPSGLAMRPIRILLFDEVDRYPASAGAEGDPVNLAKKRTVTFWNRKIIMVSTPTIKGVSRIDAAWEDSDKRRFWVPCPDCGEHQVLRWEQVQWDKDKTGKHLSKTAHYTCQHCGVVWSDPKRWSAVRLGEWRAEKPFAGIAGFHLNEIYSPWIRLEEMVRAFLSAKAQGAEGMKTFVNTSLGETWVETGEAPDWQRLYDRRTVWKTGMVPNGGLFLTAGADVQKDRIEVDVWAWGRGLESWLIDHVVIEGGPGDANAWNELNQLLDRTWIHETGAALRIAKLAIDTGYETPAVYGWARSSGFTQVAPVKGVEGFNRSSPVSGPTYVDTNHAGKRLRRGARLWTVAVSTFKAETYRFLGLARPTDDEQAGGAKYPQGSIHLPIWAETEWIKQLVAEQLVTVQTKRGFARLEWQKLRERNEALDCRVYARAAAWIAGADRWSDAKWDDLEEQLGALASSDTAGLISRPPPKPKAKRQSDWMRRRGNWF